MWVVSAKHYEQGIRQNGFDLDDSPEILQPPHDEPSSRRQGHQKREKPVESNQSRLKTLKVICNFGNTEPAFRIENRELRKAASSICRWLGVSMGGPQLHVGVLVLFGDIYLEVAS